MGEEPIPTRCPHSYGQRVVGVELCGVYRICLHLYLLVRITDPKRRESRRP